MSPTIGWSIQVWTFSTSPRALIRPVILYLPPTMNDTSVPVATAFCVALLAIAPLTKPCGVDQMNSIRSTWLPGAGAAGGAAGAAAGGAPAGGAAGAAPAGGGFGTGTFQA